MNFFGIVQDQTVNLTPMGVEGGGPCVLAPRLEGWAAACDLYDTPREDRPGLIDLARVIFEGAHGRSHERGLHLRHSSEFAPPTLEDLDRG